MRCHTVTGNERMEDGIADSTRRATKRSDDGGTGHIHTDCWLMSYNSSDLPDCL